MKITVALLMAIALTGCGASRAEKQQQDFFEVQAYSHLKRDMKEQEILNRPGFSRHLRAVHYGNHGGGYEQQAVYG